MTREFSQVDVFGSEPHGLSGNPVAVVHAAEGVDDAAMAAFARWTNLSETTFLLPPTTPEADYRLRIWTPGGELPFAGHPTLGSAHAWVEAGGVPRTPGRLVQECGVGLVELRQDAAGWAFAAPPLRRSGPVDDALRARIADVLGLEPAQILDAVWVDNGPGWIGVRLPDARTVLGLTPDFARFADLRLGVVGPHPAGAPAAVEVRAFVPGIGVPEDPVTGSLNAGLAQWLAGDVLPADYVAAQGTALGRAGRVRVRSEGEARWIGGDTVTTVRGSVHLPAARD